MKLPVPSAFLAPRRWLAAGGGGRRIAAGIAVVVGVGVLGYVAVERVTGLPDGAVLRVGDTVVTEPQFRQQLDLLEAFYGAKPPVDGPEREQFERDAAQATAVSLVVDQAAPSRGVVASDAETQAGWRTARLRGVLGGDALGPLHHRGEPQPGARRGVLHRERLGRGRSDRLLRGRRSRPSRCATTPRPRSSSWPSAVRSRASPPTRTRWPRQLSAEVTGAARAGPWTGRCG